MFLTKPVVLNDSMKQLHTDEGKFIIGTYLQPAAKVTENKDYISEYVRQRFTVFPQK